MTDNHPPDLDEVRAALIKLNNDRSESRLREAIKLLTGFTDAQIDDLGGFAEETTT